MQADKWVFILDHSFWQDCRFEVAATLGKGNIESGCRQEHPLKGASGEEGQYPDEKSS